MNAGYVWDMPFGAQYRAHGQTRFRLWAPGLSEVALALESGDRRLPMGAVGDGWFELTAPAKPGDRYRFALSDGRLVPDPASRAQAGDVHDASMVVDPRAYRWRCREWTGRPWNEAVLYELHVGTFTAQGDYDGVQGHLDRLARLGVTAIELMPLADFAGGRNWGYDGVLPFAPDRAYGTPDELKALIDAAHERGLMVLLDVVYNHFGPEGNYLRDYAPQTFTERRQTPWGAAIDYARPPVRDLFVQNALYWIEEYRFDGLRFDAVHQIFDDGARHLLTDIAEQVRATVGERRHVHLVLENDDNIAARLAPGLYDAQWNDDFHHAAHVILTGESSGYYADYAERPIERLGRALAEGFIYQGEVSPYRGEARGTPSGHLPTTAFVDFLQNHDQIGNRAMGGRLTELADPVALKALSAVLLLAPAIPMLFMGEEHGALEPFRYFVDFQGELAAAVRNGRRNEFARFADFADPAARERIPDPVDPATFHASVIDWRRQSEPRHRAWLEHHRALLAIRHDEIVPRLPGTAAGRFSLLRPDVLEVRWRLGDGAELHLLAVLSARESDALDIEVGGRQLWPLAPTGNRPGRLPGWFVGWYLDTAAG